MRVPGVFVRNVEHLSTAQLGRRGERVAARLLRRRGYRILFRNYRLRFGEIDIICRHPDGRTITIVEVKTLRYRDPARAAIYRPEGHVDARKRRTLRRLAAAVRKRHGWLNQPTSIDVVAVEFHRGRRRPVVRHHEHAV